MERSKKKSPVIINDYRAWRAAIPNRLKTLCRTASEINMGWTVDCFPTGIRV